MSAMGPRDKLKMRRMRDPIRGTIRMTGFYDKHLSSNLPANTRVTGVITAPGMSATAADFKAPLLRNWGQFTELPVMVDRSDPSRFVILWSQTPRVSQRDIERRAAQQKADQLNSEG
jgi:hypothetical protein